MKPGLVYLERGHKPFTEHRKIRRGRNKGRIEVQIRVITAPETGWTIKTVKRIVDPDQIKRYPQG